MIETTAAWAARLAGLQSGLLPGPGDTAALWRGDRGFTPGMAPAGAKSRHAAWLDALRRTR